MKGKIDTDYDQTTDVKCFIAIGIVSTNQIITAIKKFYRRKTSKYVLWDFSKAELSHLSNSVLVITGVMLSVVIKKFDLPSDNASITALQTGVRELKASESVTWFNNKLSDTGYTNFSKSHFLPRSCME